VYGDDHKRVIVDLFLVALCRFPKNSLRANVSFIFCHAIDLQFEVLLAMEHIKVYFQASSVHGFLYIINGRLQTLEKALWGVALVISFACCGLLIFKIGVKYKEDALVLYTSDITVPIVDVSPLHSSDIFVEFLPFRSLSLLLPSAQTF
jgi:hypothetical protein